MKILFAIIGSFIIFIGYLVGIKCKYPEILGYYLIARINEMPIKLIKKYSRNIGIPLIFAGICIVIIPFMYETYNTVFWTLVCIHSIFTFYASIVFVLLVKKLI